uniref:Secreted protein n=1 Tax=Rhipicephalus zambeziensis TaxID=60191 RepID=A0A224Y8W5_9ACAR
MPIQSLWLLLPWCLSRSQDKQVFLFSCYLHRRYFRGSMRPDESCRFPWMYYCVAISFRYESPTSCTCHKRILPLSTCTVSCRCTLGLHTCRRGPCSSLLSSSTLAP